MQGAKVRKLEDYGNDSFLDEIYAAKELITDEQISAACNRIFLDLLAEARVEFCQEAIEVWISGKNLVFNIEDMTNDFVSKTRLSVKDEMEDAQRVVLALRKAADEIETHMKSGKIER